MAELSRRKFLKQGTVAYILDRGFSSGKTLHVSIDPSTGKVITAIKKSNFKPDVEFNNTCRYVNLNID